MDFGLETIKFSLIQHLRPYLGNAVSPFPKGFLRKVNYARRQGQEGRKARKVTEWRGAQKSPRDIVVLIY
jgi:hypothetical protein